MLAWPHGEPLESSAQEFSETVVVCFSSTTTTGHI